MSEELLLLLQLLLLLLLLPRTSCQLFLVNAPCKADAAIEAASGQGNFISQKFNKQLRLSWHTKKENKEGVGEEPDQDVWSNS